jgi:hypothetical protein
MDQQFYCDICKELKPFEQILSFRCGEPAHLAHIRSGSLTLHIFRQQVTAFVPHVLAATRKLAADYVHIADTSLKTTAATGSTSLSVTQVASFQMTSRLLTLCRERLKHKRTML